MLSAFAFLFLTFGCSELDIIRSSSVVEFRGTNISADGSDAEGSAEDGEVAIAPTMLSNCEMLGCLVFRTGVMDEESCCGTWDVAIITVSGSILDSAGMGTATDCSAD